MCASGWLFIGFWLGILVALVGILVVLAVQSIKKDVAAFRKDLDETE